MQGLTKKFQLLGLPLLSTIYAYKSGPDIKTVRPAWVTRAEENAPVFAPDLHQFGAAYPHWP